MNASLSMILENRRLGRWGELLARSPAQLNGLQEADAELVPLPGGQQLLAVTIDTVAEELALAAVIALGHPRHQPPARGPQRLPGGCRARPIGGLSSCEHLRPGRGHE